MGGSELIMAFFPCILSTLALVGGGASNFYCDTIKFTAVDDYTLYASIWTYRTRSTVEWNDNVWVVHHCQPYWVLKKDYDYDYDLDAKARTVMAFSILAGICGLIGVAIGWVLPCVQRPISAGMWKTIGFFFLTACLFQGLTLLIMDSSLCHDNPVAQYMELNAPVASLLMPDECERSAGYWWSVSTVALYGLLGFFYVLVGPPELGEAHPQQTQTVTYQRNPDGTVQEASISVVQGNAVPPQEAPLDYDQPSKDNEMVSAQVD
eukprot:Nitzschia sp. Nitz4//scaffold145_size56662//20596//21507//NITZ4_006554-RA/size56662-snap-gene-0.90-mRNA-1//-1//CDS//3329536568//5642//frame0